MRFKKDIWERVTSLHNNKQWRKKKGIKERVRMKHREIEAASGKLR